MSATHVFLMDAIIFLVSVSLAFKTQNYNWLWLLLILGLTGGYYGKEAQK